MCLILIIEFLKKKKLNCKVVKTDITQAGGSACVGGGLTRQVEF